MNMMRNGGNVSGKWKSATGKRKIVVNLSWRWPGKQALEYLAEL
jgi:hypothetical protein